MNPNDPKYDPKHDTRPKPDERPKQPPGKGSEHGQKSPSKENPGNFANDPDRASKAGEKGGHAR
jgi:general stress protein YciG